MTESNETSVGMNGLSRQRLASVRSLAGLLGPQECHDERSVEPLVRALVHGEATPVESFRAPEFGLTLGGCTDEQPRELLTWNGARTIGFALTGEVFSLQHENGTATDHPAVETLLEAYAQDGKSALARFNGWFSLLIIDRRYDRILICNDRYGLGRIYWHGNANRFLFASEAKALLSVLPASRRLDPRGVAEFISNGCVLQNRSLFADIQILPGGSCWTFERGRLLEKGRYFDSHTWANLPPLTESEYTEELIRVFARVVRRYLQDERGAAMSLTGGLDSRMVLAWGHPAPGTLPCYTFGGPFRECADVTIARELARVCQQPHQTLAVEPDFFRDFVTLAERNIQATDGAMDVSGAIEIYMNRKARRIAPVRLTGNYGSEILRSNVAFRPGRPDRTQFTSEFNELLDEARETYAREAQGSRIGFIAFKQVAWHHFARFAAERSQLTPRSPFLDNELVELAFRIPKSLEGDPRPLLALITRGNRSLDAVRTDRALRANLGILGRFQREWQEFTAKAEYAYDYGMPTWLVKADRLLSPLHLERLFLGRHKFYHYRIWYRDQLKDALRSGAYDRPLPFYRDGVPAALIRDHTTGRSNRTIELHKLLTLQLTDRLLTGQACHT